MSKGQVADKLFGEGFCVPVQTQYGDYCVIPDDKYHNTQTTLRSTALPGYIELRIDAHSLQYATTQPAPPKASIDIEENLL